MIPLLKWRIATYLINFYSFCSTIVEKRGQLDGNADTFMPIFSADTLTLDFLVTDIFLEERAFFLVT